MISKNGKLDATIQARKVKACSYMSKIKALLSDMPFGKRRLEIGLMLRDAMFVNQVLCNSKAWHYILNNHIEELEVINRQLMRHIIGAHATALIEFLYLETLPLKHVITCRRLLYLKTILKREDHELVKRIYRAQQENPLKKLLV